MTIPTLETEAGALTLRITDGTSGDHVAYDDVWNWPDGVAAGNGDVPKDGGGTVKVNTFLTEIVANAMYTIQKNIDFGDGSTSTFFKSLNEQIYFDDGKVWSLKDQATLEWGELVGDWGANGSVWSVNPDSATDLIGFPLSGAAFNAYNSTLHNRGTSYVRFNGADIILNKFTFKGSGPTSNGTMRLWSGIQSLSMKDVYFVSAKALDLLKTSSPAEDVHVHDSTSGVYVQYADGVVLEDYRGTNAGASQVRTFDTADITLRNPREPIITVKNDSAGGIIIGQQFVNITVNDRNGAALESATVALTSFGNIVSNDSGSTFYRCIVDHTAGTFATDVSAGNWEVTTTANAALAGGVDSDGNPTPLDGTAGNGEWITGIDYVAAAEEFSVSTDANGDIAEQTETFKKWVGTSVALLSSSPHTLVISKATFETLTKDNISLTAPITSTTPEELLPVLAESDVKQDVEYGEDKTGTYDIDHMAGAVALGAVAVSGVMGVARATVTEAKAELVSAFSEGAELVSGFTTIE